MAALKLPISNLQFTMNYRLAISQVDSHRQLLKATASLIANGQLPIMSKGGYHA